MPIDVNWLIGGYSFKNGLYLNKNLPINHERNNSIFIEVSEDNNLLCIDIDIDEDTKFPEYVDRFVKEVVDFDNDLISYSSKYNFEDLKTGKCRFKVFYRYYGESFTRNKLNAERCGIELLYFGSKGRNKWVKFAGDRGKDNYENIVVNYDKEIRTLHVDMNDYTKYKEKIQFLNIGDVKVVEVNEYTPIDTSMEIEDGEIVDVDEFISCLEVLGLDSPTDIVDSDERLLTFTCIFKDAHSDIKSAKAYAFKRGGVYVTKCHGVVCSGEYDKLNSQLKSLSLNNIDVDGFGDWDGDTIYKAPTGWGKTEKIAQEIILAIRDNRKLLVLMQDKNGIQRLMDRVNFYSKGMTKLFLAKGELYEYTSENSSSDNDFEGSIEKANVIISHHNYFSNAGDVITQYSKSKMLLEMDNLEVIIDEAHTFIEVVTRNTLVIGGLYDERIFNSKKQYYLNRHKLINNYTNWKDFVASVEKKVYITKCVEAKLSSYGTVVLDRPYELKEGVEYLDVLGEVRERFDIIDQYKEDNVFYQALLNPNQNQDVLENNITHEVDPLALLLDYSENVVVGLNFGDGVGRTQIGTVTAVFYQNLLLKAILKHKFLLLSATYTDYHMDEVKKINPEVKFIDVDSTIDKVTNIVLLYSEDENSSRIRRSTLEFLQSLNVDSLIYLSTISACEKALKYLQYSELNNNGIYSYVKDKVEDFGGDKHLTLAGLESTVAKGYNYLTELDGRGFSLIYFDSMPVSPNIIKKYIKDGRIEDYSYDYELNVFAQAIGRAFRKQKDNLTLIFNRVDNSMLDKIKGYLESNTNANVILAPLTKTNIKLSLSSVIEENGGVEELSKVYGNNDIFKRLYL
jgi:hypothetical protein